MNSNSLREAVEGFLSAVAGDVSKSTRRWYADRLRDFAMYAGDEHCPDEIRAATIRAYRAHLIERGLTEHSIHGYQRALRRFFGWLVDEGEICRNVARDVPFIKLPPQPPKALTDDDLGRFLAQLPRESLRDKAIILFLADTGCRVGGLCSLRLDTLDLESRCALVIEKGRKGRRVYFTEETAAALSAYLDRRPDSDSDAVFLSDKGRRPLGTDGVRRMLVRVAERAGVRGRHNAHSFRHAFARSFLKNGGNLATLGRLLGHSPGSPVTARYYAIFDDRELKEFHDRYSPIARRDRER